MIYSQDDDLYYHSEYLPSYLFPQQENEQTRFSRTIWAFKNGDNGVISNFARILASDVISLAAHKHIYSNEIALVAVPSSHARTHSSVQRCIEEACDILQNSIHPKNYRDWSDCLIRESDIQTAHLAATGGRPTYTDQINSLSCSRNNISHYYLHIILVDDIYTTGTSIMACRQILQNNGAYPEYIANYVFGKTVH